MLVAAASARRLLTLHLHGGLRCPCLVLCWDLTAAAEATCTVLPGPFVMVIKHQAQQSGGGGMQQLQKATWWRQGVQRVHKVGIGVVARPVSVLQTPYVQSHFSCQQLSWFTVQQWCCHSQ